ncbi:glycosyltransferase [Butyrivibrio sp. VCD2006]|uniref:glycosyltransferase n=1 Tax=Butyrivibrio sp. VCD2006 TaxID=1280664 RepID=UPI0004152ABA|nr:glycosyltransferase [Butyrivibrio sp. VCD2006]
MPLFSIIIPVYNRENYIDRSVNSILGQDFDDWELIIVDDGSTDSSLKKCKQYEHEDENHRIHVIAKENEGPGAARNVGLENVTGEYVLFLDSDDWYESNCLSKCAFVIKKCKPDIVNFFMREWYHGTSRINKRSLLVNKDRKDDIYYLMQRDISIGTRACKMDIIRNNNIKYPEWRTSEDIGFMQLCYAAAESVYQLPEVFYNYDKGVLVSAAKTHGTGDKHLIDTPYNMKGEFEKINRYKEFKDILAKSFLTHIKYTFPRERDRIREAELTKIYKSICDELYPELFPVVTGKYLVFGSYTLRSSVQSIMLNAMQIRHFQFESIISAIQKEQLNISFDTNNSYRKEMVYKEFGRDFVNQIKDGENDYLIIDLLEERNDLLTNGKCWITRSEAVCEGQLEIDESWRCMSRGELSVKKAFEKTCKELVNLIDDNFDGRKIIIVENYLMENKGEFGPETFFEDKNRIREINTILSGYYSFLEKSLKKARIIKPHAEGLCFSDVDYRHGCQPWHSSEAWESREGEMILDVLLRE